MPDFSFPTLSGLLLAVVLALMVGLWGMSLVRRDASVVDPFWGAGFAIVAWLAWAACGGGAGRPLLLVCLTTVWGLRLALYLLRRNWGHGEDPRYTAMRAQHGERFARVSLVTVFLLQGILMWWVALPVQAGVWLGTARPIGWLDGAGVALWGVGLFFETVGDWQLARFRSDPANRGQVLDRGLWRYTRHPNYFGDFCVWWGLYLVAAAGGAWWTALSPLVMSLLLMRVSGVTLLESTIVERRPAYADYVGRTNAFFPGPPRPAADAP